MHIVINVMNYDVYKVCVIEITFKRKKNHKTCIINEEQPGSSGSCAAPTDTTNTTGGI